MLPSTPCPPSPQHPPADRQAPSTHPPQETQRYPTQSPPLHQRHPPSLLPRPSTGMQQDSENLHRMAPPSPIDVSRHSGTAAAVKHPTNPLQLKRQSGRSHFGRSEFCHRHTFASSLNVAERVTNLPSEVIFQIEMLPETLSLPSSKMSARLAGGLLNLVHLCVCISRIRRVPESVTGWEEMYMEAEEQPWFDWVCLSASAHNPEVSDDYPVLFRRSLPGSS